MKITISSTGFFITDFEEENMNIFFYENGVIIKNGHRENSGFNFTVDENGFCDNLEIAFIILEEYGEEINFIELPESEYDGMKFPKFYIACKYAGGNPV